MNDNVMRKNNWEIALRFNDLVQLSDGIFFGCDMYSNRAYTLNFYNDGAKCVFVNDKIPSNALHQCFSLEKHDEDIWMFPFWSKSICKYNVENNYAEYYEISDEYLMEKEVDKGPAIVETIFFDNKFYCFGMSMKAIISVDLDGEIKYHNKLFNKIGLYMNEGSGVKCPVYLSTPDDQGNVIAIFKDSEFVIKYNLKTEESEILLRSDDLNTGVVDAVFDGEDIYISKRNELLTLNIFNGEKRVFDRLPNEYNMPPNEITSFGIEDIGNRLFLFPYFSNMLMIFDKSSGQFQQIQGLIMEGHENEFKIDKSRVFGDTIMLFSRFDKSIYEFDKKLSLRKKHQFVEAGDVYLELDNTKEFLIINEGDFENNALNGFIDYVIKKDNQFCREIKEEK